MNGDGERASQREGQWESIQYRFKHLPIHIALLRTGKVLAFGGTGNDESAKSPYPAETWDPITGEAKEVGQEIPGDIFCCGHAFLPDGRLLVAGGTYGYNGTTFGLPIPPFQGLEQSYIFDPANETWTRTGDMANGRWYPTLVSLGTGQVVAMAGLTKGFPWAFLREIEIFTPGLGWKPISGAGRWLPLYPRLHLLPSGKVFYAGSYNTHYTFPFTLRGFPTGTLDVVNRRWRTIGPPNQSQREEGTSVLLPLVPPDYHARVLLIGGGAPGGKIARADVEIISPEEEHPRWERVESMTYPRYYCYATILPDQSILVLGGHQGIGRLMHQTQMQSPEMHMEHDHSGDEVPQNPDAIRTPELLRIPEHFTIEDLKWTPMAPMQLDRLYHANALLLPDGRVMAAGSNPKRRTNELRIELYHPPYFNGERPVIEDHPLAVQYGTSFEIRVTSTSEIKAVALIRSSATTHCVNVEQRYVGLTFDDLSGGRFNVKMPDNRNLAPPGYYLLFVVTQEGIPSSGGFIQTI